MTSVTYGPNVSIKCESDESAKKKKKNTQRKLSALHTEKNSEINVPRCSSCSRWPIVGLMYKDHKKLQTEATCLQDIVGCSIIAVKRPKL